MAKFSQLPQILKETKEDINIKEESILQKKQEISEKAWNYFKVKIFIIKLKGWFYSQKKKKKKKKKEKEKKKKVKKKKEKKKVKKIKKSKWKRWVRIKDIYSFLFKNKYTVNQKSIHPIH